MPTMMAEDESIIFNNILVLTEVSVKSHMKVKVIVRVTGGGHPPKAQQPHTETNSATQVLPASSCYEQVAQARSSGATRESSGASSGSPSSPWGSGETKKGIVDALKNEHSDIHLFISDETSTTGCKINYAEIQKRSAPKHEMTKFRQNFKRMIESKKNMTGPFKETAKKKKNEIEPWLPAARKHVLGTLFCMTCTLISQT